MPAPDNLQLRAKLFISYRREDSSGHAGRLYDRINSRFGDELEIFMDVDSLAPGEDFVEAIEQAVDDCDVFVAIIGRDWLTALNRDGERRLDNPNDFVRVEIEAALSRNIRVIPILVQGAGMPNVNLLPEALAKLSRRHALELSDTRWNQDVVRLIKTLETIINQKKENTPAAALSAQDASVVDETPPPEPVFIPARPRRLFDILEKIIEKFIVNCFMLTGFLREVIRETASTVWDGRWWIAGFAAFISGFILIFQFVYYSNNLNTNANNAAPANATPASVNNAASTNVIPANVNNTSPGNVTLKNFNDSAKSTPSISISTPTPTPYKTVTPKPLKTVPVRTPSPTPSPSPSASLRSNK